MFKNFKSYLYIANGLMLLHCIGHLFGHFITFIYPEPGSSDAIAMDSMLNSVTPGGRTYYQIFTSFSLSYSILLAFISVLDLYIVSSNKAISSALQKRFCEFYLIFYTAFGLILTLANGIDLSIMACAVMIVFYLIAWLLLRKQIN